MKRSSANARGRDLIHARPAPAPYRQQFTAHSPLARARHTCNVRGKEDDHRIPASLERARVAARLRRRFFVAGIASLVLAILLLLTSRIRKNKKPQTSAYLLWLLFGSGVAMIILAYVLDATNPGVPAGNLE